MIEPTVTYRSTVTADQIDHLGHMNVRFYGTNARAGSMAFVERLRRRGQRIDGVSIQAVDVYTRHRREQLEGAELTVRTLPIGVDDTSLTLYHELQNDHTGDLAATFVHRLQARGPEGPVRPWPGDVEGLEIAPLPAGGRPRSIRLDSDPVASAPTLEQARDRGLTMRLPRDVEDDECGPDGSVGADDVPFLLWGGEPVDDATGPMLHDGPDGAVIGWASMETRMVVRRLPRLGDRIQSFGATVAVADKTTHQIMWAYDLDRDDLLCTFEVINLAFDTVGRRAVSIPDELRERSRRRLHQDLLPT